MIVSGKVCEKRGSSWVSRSSKEAERAASLAFILEVSAVICTSIVRKRVGESIRVNKYFLDMVSHLLFSSSTVEILTRV